MTPLPLHVRAKVQPFSGTSTNGKDYDADDDLYLRESVLEGISKRTNWFTSKQNSPDLHSNVTTLLNIPEDESITETIPSMTSELDNDVEILFFPKGYLAALTGFPSFVNIRASTDTYVGFLPKQSLNKINGKES
ncbi:unnamed protein product [Rhizophagus irregularis]|nr:unnamed protein product [Rhizophagus irregularis]